MIGEKCATAGCNERPAPMESFCYACRDRVRTKGREIADVYYRYCAGQTSEGQHMVAILVKAYTHNTAGRMITCAAFLDAATEGGTP